MGITAIRGHQGAQAAALSRLLLAAGLAAVLWLPLPNGVALAGERHWAEALLGLVALVALIALPPPGLSIPRRASQCTSVAVSVAVGIGVAVVVALTGGWASPLEFLFLLPPLAIDIALGGVGVALAATLVPVCYLVAAHAALPVAAGALLGRACVWCVLGTAVQALRTVLAHRYVTFERLRWLLRDRQTELLALERARGEFLAHVSHELLTPLAAIQAGAGLLAAPDLRLTADTVPPSELAIQRRLALNVQRNTARLTVLVDDLLELARLEEGRAALELAWHPCDVVLARAQEAVALLLEARCQRSAWEVMGGPLALWGDARRIEQILVNLLVNAHKYAGHGATITLIARAEGAGVRLEVCDNGPGLDPTTAERLFDRYYRGGTGSPERGSGLGLSITAALVELHHGTVWVEEHGGPGCRFVIWLPDPASAARPCVRSRDERAR